MSDETPYRTWAIVYGVPSEGAGGAEWHIGAIIGGPNTAAEAIQKCIPRKHVNVWAFAIEGGHGPLYGLYYADPASDPLPGRDPVDPEDDGYVHAPVHRALEAAVREAIELMAGPLGRARCRAEGAEQGRDLDLVRDGMAILRGALER